MKALKIILISFLPALFGCSSSVDESFSRDELLRDRIEKKSFSAPKIALTHNTDIRSFQTDSLRIENPELIFTYFPEVLNSGVSEPKKVRFSVFENVHYKKGY